MISSGFYFTLGVLLALFLVIIFYGILVGCITWIFGAIRNIKTYRGFGYSYWNLPLAFILKRLEARKRK